MLEDSELPGLIDSDRRITLVEERSRAPKVNAYGLALWWKVNASSQSQSTKGLFVLPTDGIYVRKSDLIDNLAPYEARGIDRRRLIGSERYSDGLRGTLPGATCKEPGLTIRSVSALFTLPPGFRILYIAHRVKSPRLPQGLLPARVETVTSKFLFPLPPWPASTKEALIFVLCGKRFDVV